MAEHSITVDPRQRRQSRRLAIRLGLVALSLYAAYIIFALRHGHA